jgi:hypothetical protein
LCSSDLNAISNSNAGGEIVKKPEQRRESRYHGRLPVRLESGEATTRDFSGSGVFFETDRSFSPGQQIEFTIVLEHIDPERPVHLKCSGEILRVEENGQKIGVAVAINSYTFEELKQ